MPFKKKIVLVADDSETFVMYISILLSRMGFNIIPAESGVEVMKLLRIITPDVILMDMHMADMSGVETLEKIKADPQSSHVPVIMVSVEPREEMVEKCKGLGSAGYLSKPVKIDDLHHTLEDSLYATYRCRRRRHLRAHSKIKVNIINGNESHELYAESISQGGIYVRKKEPFPVGAEVDVIVPLEDESLCLKGTVIYIKGVYGDVYRVPAGMAIEFRDVSEANSAALLGCVADILTRDIVETQEETVITPESESALLEQNYPPY